MARFIQDSVDPDLLVLQETGVYYVKGGAVGRKNPVSLRTTDHKQARKRKLEAIVGITGQNTKGEVMFAPVAEDYLAIKKTMAESTYAEAECIIRRYIMPYFGPSKRYPNGMTIAKALKSWDEYHSINRVENPRRQLTHDRKHVIGILNLAARTHGTTRPYAKDFKLDLIDKAPTKMKIYEPEEVQRLMRCANKKWQLILELAVVLGMRFGEIRQLKFSDIDFDRHEMILSRSITKTRRDRIVAFDTHIERQLRAIQSTRTNKADREGYVFPWTRVLFSETDYSRPMAKRQTTWERILRRAGLRGRFHDLRHVCASNMLRAGVPSMHIALTLGMSSQTLARIYAHINGDDRQAAVRAARKALQVIDAEKTDFDWQNDEELSTQKTEKNSQNGAK